MSDDESYWLRFILKLVIFLLAVAFIFVIGLVMAGAFLLSVYP